MQHTVCTSENGFCWVDVVAPTKKELQQIAAQYKLHPASVKDCLDPEHLPKHERIGSVTFIIARCFDMRAGWKADTVQELTRKISVFVGDNFLLTVHRTDLPFMAELRERWAQENLKSAADAFYILCDLALAVLQTFDKPINDAQSQLETYEPEIFRGRSTPTILQDLYFLRRKASVYKRMLRLMSELLPKLNSALGAVGDAHEPRLQDLRENSDRFLFHAEELVEAVNQLLNLHVSLSSHRTNDVMRVLTVFSVFFMPLTFIVGVYGMNFRYMPELEHRYGYFLIWALMLGVCASIFVWFRRKGWLEGFRRSPKQKELEREMG